MAKKLIESNMVFQFRRARRTQCQLNVSCLTSSAASAPWLSKRMRATAPCLSSSVRNLQSEGVCGRKNVVSTPNAMVMAPSTKKMKGQP